MKLWYTFLKDVRLSVQGWYFYTEFVFTLLIVAVLLFVVPENFTTKIRVYAHVELGGAFRAAVEKGLSRDEFAVTFLDSREEVERRLEQDRRSVGLSVTREGGKVVYDYILQGYESRRIRNVIALSIEAQFASRLPSFVDATRVFTVGETSEKLSDRLNILPVFLALNAAFMGLFIIAAYIFLDKEEGTIKAFAVTPACVWHYLLSKMAVMLTTGLLSGLVAAALVAGAHAHYLHLSVLLIATNLFGSAVGLFIASFFDTLQKAMGWLYMSIIVLAMASVSYYMPAFSPVAIRMLPSYPMLFAFRETLLDRPDVGYIYLNVLGFTVAAILLFLPANRRFKKSLAA